MKTAPLADEPRPSLASAKTVPDDAAEILEEIIVNRAGTLNGETARAVCEPISLLGALVGTVFGMHQGDKALANRPRLYLWSHAQVDVTSAEGELPVRDVAWAARVVRLVGTLATRRAMRKLIAPNDALHADQDDVASVHALAGEGIAVAFDKCPLAEHVPASQRPTFSMTDPAIYRLIPNR
ncbi:MAG TPA: hypothetical protein VHR72_13440 [Gemmataceae bacterium]|jgi:hypothetical protein|nr:hypothetical protein [Gemmataceae bacterium]